MKTLLHYLLFTSLIVLWSGCYHYRLSTQALPASEPKKVIVHSYLWGILNNPQFVSTPSCDAMGVNGVAEVYAHTNLGFALLTVATLGIWCPMVIEYRCSKPCLPNNNDSL